MHPQARTDERTCRPLHVRGADQLARIRSATPLCPCPFPLFPPRSTDFSACFIVSLSPSVSRATSIVDIHVVARVWVASYSLQGCFKIHPTEKRAVLSLSLTRFLFPALLSSLGVLLRLLMIALDRARMGFNAPQVRLVAAFLRSHYLRKCSFIGA